MANTIVWADIPVKDLDRAREFYSKLLGREMVIMPGMEDVSIPAPAGNENEVAFDLFRGISEPSELGTRIYFDAEGDIAGMIQRAELAGGTVLSPPRDMGPMVGIIAFVRDTEGNQIGLRQDSAQQAPQ